MREIQIGLMRQLSILKCLSRLYLDSFYDLCQNKIQIQNKYDILYYLSKKSQSLLDNTADSQSFIIGK
jgi:hypothetical protein